jgi:hypothetical protein
MTEVCDRAVAEHIEAVAFGDLFLAISGQSVPVLMVCKILRSSQATLL